jgi:peptidoglycan/xylan/chitin deacetylase (PgdA/CDA1 family)
MLKDAKLAVLKAGKATGLFNASRHLRGQRLLILCYHGISFEDEHLWNPGLYIDRATFRARLEMLRGGGYRVLPLGEALSLMQRNELPPRSVVLTFDDGSHDFHALALPILREFGFPATVYLSTYYCRYQAPVFDVACGYLLWQSIGKKIDTTGILPDTGVFHIADQEQRRRLQIRMVRHVRETAVSAREKDMLLNEIATRLGADIGGLRDRRMLYYMNPAEIREVHESGVDIQLHTHRHRMPRDRGLFAREITDNIREIQAITGSPAVPSHFCYPCGDYEPVFYDWLRELGVESATTCQPGLASKDSNPFELPRLLDMPTLSSIEFEGWLTGFSGMFPQRDSRVLHNQRFQE